MHILTTQLFNAGQSVFAALPTYFNPAYFVFCKFHIEFRFDSLNQTYYHGIITELLAQETENLKVLSSSTFRVINRKTRRLELQNLRMPMLTSNEAMLQHIMNFQKQWVFDIPAPFCTGSLENLRYLKNHITDFFRKQIHEIDKAKF